MRFESVEQLLKWYFKRKYARGPKPPGNHESVTFGFKKENTEDTFMTLMRVKYIIEAMSFRERSVIKQFYTGIHPATIAKRRGYSEKTLRRAVARINDDLLRTFKSIGLIMQEAKSLLPDFFEKEEL